MTSVQSVNQFVENLVNSNKKLSGEKLLAHFHTQEVQDALSSLLAAHSAKSVTHGRRRQARVVDPNRPKRALTAFLFFTRDHRVEVSQNNPNLDQKGLLSELGRMWRALSEEDRAPYQARHLEDKQRYGDQMKSYVPSPNHEQELSPRSKKQKREVKPTGYHVFSSSRRAELKAHGETHEAKDLMRRLGAEWKALTDAERTRWNDRAKAANSGSQEVAPEQPKVVEVAPPPPPVQAAPVVEEKSKRSKKSAAQVAAAPAAAPEKPAREHKSKKKARRVVDEE